MDCLVIGLEETSEGGNDPKDWQVAPGYRLCVLMVERFGFIHVSVQLQLQMNCNSLPKRPLGEEMIQKTGK